MPTRSREKLVINPGFSWPLALILLLSHATALAILPLLQLGSIIKLLMAAAVFFSLIYYARQDLFARGRKAVTSVEWSEAGGWRLIDQQGNYSTASLLGSSYLHRYLVILNFKLPDGAERRMILTPGSVNADLFRRLRACLEWMRSPQGE